MYRQDHVFVVLCAVLLAGQVTAVPAGTGINPHSPPLGPFESVRFASQTQSQIASSRGPFTWLRDTVIERIWGIDKKHSNKVGSQPRPEKSWSRYGSDIVLRMEVHSTEEVEALADAVNILFLDVWDSNENYVDIRMAKEVVPSLLGLLPQSLQKSHTLLIEDLSKAIYESRYPTRDYQRHTIDQTDCHTVPRPLDVADLFFDHYQPFNVILQWMRLIVSMFPSHAQLVNVGVTHEGRDIPAFRLGVRSRDDEQEGPRKTIMIVGGSHAREWISTSTVAYIAFQLVTEFGNSVAITKLLEDFDWVLVPTINPDGYVYSWDMDRLWRKNRQPTGLPFCPGIDLDRSWGYEWDGQGTRANPCSESYAGNNPFDSIETRTIAEWAYNQTQDKRTDFIGFLDLHSYSQQILYPYSYSCSTVPPTLENLEELAFGIAKAIRMTNQEAYAVKSACEGVVTTDKGNGQRVSANVESTGGSALDWFYHQLHAKYSYQIKLRDKGMYGFLLPPEHIVPTGREIFNSVLVLGHFLLGEDANALEWEFIPGSKSTSEQENGSSRTFDRLFFNMNEDELEKPGNDRDYSSVVEEDVYQDEGWGLW
ncbi:zinc carboxypeptidase, putative [Talaromyces stipitatus ATCC 10500]|uniref:Inactive metallocarboxypeptidase ecm14 n=1 Tax=Talaromyces stipitatus (strain ATCC 10500 / CBS 375.48 / QM 6759 / NRRL 1006) TaxID=441959 RepID=ECM14_TALSN|nr:zinc carboxypeptidase, putative [Talaromyces stipitatus ATCC 10500]B8M2K0.1 RecName: Full=Inactive metallocarboxypeptidase ecm14; Flags: Precursor [Talaromyces stipitatus ATCC 10500]EED21911.1 zinc carboxypeptidase, putative [Talaromyces stipitatus ATCC 10500]